MEFEERIQATRVKTYTQLIILLFDLRMVPSEHELILRPFKIIRLWRTERLK